jgi:hypothetical protein
MKWIYLIDGMGRDLPIPAFKSTVEGVLKAVKNAGRHCWVKRENEPQAVIVVV